MRSGARRKVQSPKRLTRLLPPLLIALLAVSAHADGDAAARARAAFQRADYETALKAYEQIPHDKAGPSGEVELQIARCLDRLLRSNEAIVAYLRVLHAGVSEGDANEARARIALLKKHLSQGASAERIGSLAIERGTALFAAELYTEARAEFAAAGKVLPDKPNAWRWLGLTDEKLGHCALALPSFQSFLLLVDSDDPRVAQVTEAQERCEARLAREKSPAADKRQAAPVRKAGGGSNPGREAQVKKEIDRGTELFLAKRYDEARESFANARTLAPEKATPYRWLGLIDARKGRCAEAAKNLKVFLSRVDASDPRVVEAEEALEGCADKSEPAQAPRPTGAKVPAAHVETLEEKQARARADIERAEVQRKQGQLEAARESLHAALKELPNLSAAHRLLGLVDAQLGHCTEAMAAFDDYLSRSPTGENRAEAERERERCQRLLAPKGTLIVTSNPPGAEVRLDRPDGAAAGTTPWTETIETLGAHVVYLDHAGYLQSSARVELRDKQTTRVVATLRPVPKPVEVVAPPVSPPPPPAPSGSTEPPSVHKEPAAAPAVAPASPASATLDERMGGTLVPVAVGAGSLVVLVVGAGIAGSANADLSHLAATCAPRCSTSAVNSDIAERDTGYAFIAVGAAGLAVDAVLWTLWYRNRHHAPPHVWITPTTNGALVSGTF